MADPQKEILEALAQLEKAYQKLRSAAQSQAKLLSLGAARCTEIREYNLLMMATYNMQAGWLELLRSQGVDASEYPPFPTLFALPGVTGQEALSFDCSKLPTYVGPSDLKIITSDVDFMSTGPEAPKFTHHFDVPAELGVVGPLIVIAGIAIGLAITGASAAYIAKTSKDKKIAVEETKQLAMRSEQIDKSSARRLKIYTSCLAAINPGDTKALETCRRTAELEKIPDGYFSDGTPRYDSGLLGLFGKIAIVAALAIGGGIFYKRWKRRKEEKLFSPSPSSRGRPRLRKEVETEDWGF